MEEITIVEETTPQTEPLAPQAETQSPEQPKTKKEILSDLLTSRTGTFDLKITHADLKYLKNTMQSKVEWKGPNEAYLTIMTILTLSNALDEMNPKATEAVTVKLPSSTFESLNYFLNKISGTGLDSAQRLFSATMILRPTIEAIKKLDAEIDTLKEELKTEEKP